MRAVTSPVTAFGAACVGIANACGNPTSSSFDSVEKLECSIPTAEIFDGGPGKDGIPALVNPNLVSPDDPSLDYLLESDRVIGLEWNGNAVAVPLNVGWWHEIVNLDLAGLQVAITHCPLTGSSLAFDRAPAGGATFGVSGLLYQNNLIMYDRNQAESLWPQMTRGAQCGPRLGAALTMIPVVEMTWKGWWSLHPDTRVVAGGGARNYRSYPYGSYDDVGNEQLLFPVRNLDRRRALKERVLGIPDGETGGIAFPFGALDAIGPVAAVHSALSGSTEVVVLWDRAHASAMAYRPVARGQRLRFESRAGAIVDVETSSQWDVNGRARSGPLAGERLEPVAEAYTAFWFAWAAFHRDTQLWTETSS